MLILNCKSQFHKIFKLLNENPSRNIVLTGGKTVYPVYKFLNKNNFFIKKNIYLTDERIVSLEKDYKFTNSYLIEKKLRLKMKKFYSFYFQKKFIPIFYFKNFKSNFEIDLIFLSYAEDGHIASIFNFEKKERNNIIFTSSKHHKFNRITMSIKLISKAKKIVLLMQNNKRFNFFKKNHLNNNKNSLLKNLKKLIIVKLYQ